MTNQPKRLLLFTAKLGYQTRSFEDAAQKLGVQLVYVTDRCHQLEDPWGDQAIAVHFETPEAAAHTVMETLRGRDVAGILALGDRPAASAAYAARGLGVHHNHPATVEACRSKPRVREIFRDAGLNVPRFRPVRAWCARTIATNSSPQPQVCAGWSNPRKFLPLASRISIKCSSKDTYQEGKSRSKDFLRMARYACWRSSTNPIHSKGRTSKRQSTSRLPGFLNPRNTPSRNAQKTQCARWVFHMDQSTRSFASTITACGRSKLLPARSAVFAPDPCDFLLTRRPNQSDSRSCLFATRWNSPDGIRLANEPPL